MNDTHSTSHLEISPGLVVKPGTPRLALSDYKLIAFDMDSTLINIECVDEIADAVGRKAEVAAITEAAMRGEIAELKVLLVSGGFTFFADRVRDTLGIDYLRANVLEQANGLLTGRMVDQPWGDICDGAEKRKMLLQTCADLGISAEQTIAMGDGANDLPMMGAAGLSVAYHAKPQVRAQAMVAINEGGLDRLLEVLNG